jgi:hypothetical protein
MAAAACQSIGACRGRRGDRRAAADHVVDSVMAEPEVRRAA